MGDDAHGTKVCRPGSILDTGSEDTGSTGDHGALNASLEGVDRMVWTILTVGRHFQMVERVVESSKEGQLLSSMLMLCVLSRSPFPVGVGGGTTISN